MLHSRFDQFFAPPATYTLSMASKRKVEARFLKHGKWWVGWSEDVPGALTQGRTLSEARENLKDAIRLMLEPVDLRRLPQARTRYVAETLTL